jgi:thiol-disulfide isomerase/thioredoxin
MEYMKKLLAIVILVGLVGYTVYTQVIMKETEEAATEASGQTNPFNPNENIGTAIMKGPLINESAPNFTLQTVDGEKVTLSDLKGKKVFINFWATWCPPCRDEMPEIEQYAKENPDIVVLAVNLRNTEKSDEAVHNFIKEFEYTFPVLLDQKGNVGNAYKILTLPTSYFVNTEGIVQFKFIGPLNLEKMNELVSTLD